MLQSDSIESTIGLARTLLRTNRLEEAENILQVVKKKFINIAIVKPIPVRTAMPYI